MLGFEQAYFVLQGCEWAFTFETLDNRADIYIYYYFLEELLSSLKVLKTRRKKKNKKKKNKTVINSLKSIIVCVFLSLKLKSVRRQKCCWSRTADSIQDKSDKPKMLQHYGSQEKIPQQVRFLSLHAKSIKELCTCRLKDFG